MTIGPLPRLLPHTPLTTQLMRDRVIEVMYSTTNRGLWAAGMLPLAKGPNDRAYALLAQTKPGPTLNSRCWESFTTKREPEESLARAAERALQQQSHSLVELPFNWKKQCLILTNHKNGSALFLPRISYDPSLPDQFREVPELLASLQNKTAIQWVEFKQLLEQIQEAKRLSQQEGCSPDLLPQRFWVKEGLRLSPDFIATLVVGLKTPQFYNAILDPAPRSLREPFLVSDWV